MEEYSFTWYDPVLVDDYRAASNAHGMAVLDFQKASDMFVKYQDNDAKKILVDCIDNLLKAASLKTRLAVCLADSIVSPSSWRSHLDVDKRRREAIRGAAEIIKNRAAEFKDRYGCDHAGCELKA
jgi:hypothetical protein